jgi:hypothetical protein
LYSLGREEIPMVRVTNDGTIWQFRLETPEEKAWVEENVQLEDWQWMGEGTFSVDHRFGPQLVVGMRAEGLEVGPS